MTAALWVLALLLAVVACALGYALLLLHRLRDDVASNELCIRALTVAMRDRLHPHDVR